MSRYHKIGHCVVGFYEDSREGGRITAFIFDEDLKPIREIKDMGEDLYAYYARENREIADKDSLKTD